MKITLTLNEKETALDADSNERLSSVLRRNNYRSIKAGCGHTSCGNCCTVLLDGLPVSSCMIPVGIVHGSAIVTLEHYEKSAVYSDIMHGFSRAGIVLCGYCNSAKIFAAHHVITHYKRPTRRIIDAAVRHLAPCCIDKDTLINGIIYASDSYAKHMGAHSVR
ncbi:MAG: 2Fe-2S iron-sulfur cluster binding domain-containing protein [Treponema sp.]|nr:2Fe-2S iron-sulfur cluster binding domain-containing protein [Treponema sp.]